MEVLTTALAAIQGASTIARTLMDSKTSVEQIELKQKLTEVIDALLTSKMALSAMQDELLEQKKTINAQAAMLELENEVVWKEPYYYRVAGGTEDGPFCPRCWDVNRKLVRPRNNGNGCRTCMECKSIYDDPGSRFNEGHLSRNSDSDNATGY